MEISLTLMEGELAQDSMTNKSEMNIHHEFYQLGNTGVVEKSRSWAFCANLCDCILKNEGMNRGHK